MSNPTQITSLRIPTETLITTKILTEKDSGKAFLLDLVDGFTVTLPPVAKAGNGFSISFVVKTSPTTAYIITEDATVDVDVLTGGSSSAELTSLAVAAYSAAYTQINFVASEAVLGDWATVTSDGIRYYTHVHTNVQAGVTLT